MSAANLQALHVLLERSEQERDRLVGARQQAQAAADAAKAQAEQLYQYRRDYQQRWQTQFRQSGPVELVRTYQSFNERLGVAVDQQARVADHAAGKLATAAQAVIEAEMRCASVKKLIERRVLEARMAAEKRDQKQTDEAAARAWSAQGRFL